MAIVVVAKLLKKRLTICDANVLDTVMKLSAQLLAKRYCSSDQDCTETETFYIKTGACVPIMKI